MFEPLTGSSDLWQVITILLNLGLVLLLIFALAAVMRRFKIGTGGYSGKQLGLVETLYLSPKQKVHLVRAGEKIYLVGATDTNLSLLSEVELEALPETAPETMPPAQKLLAERLTALHLDKFLPRWGTSAAPVQPGPGNNS